MRPLPSTSSTCSMVSASSSSTDSPSFNARNESKNCGERDGERDGGGGEACLERVRYPGRDDIDEEGMVSSCEEPQVKGWETTTMIRR
jgi:hypothetical protein